MKILSVGCSLSAGYGLPLGINDPHCWPNLLKARDKTFEVENLSVPGYDNTGIFLKVLDATAKSNYDIILVQITGLTRHVVSPNIHGIINLSGPIGFHHWKRYFTRTEFLAFHDVYHRINGPIEHWLRLCIMISILQQIPNLKFVNGLLAWDLMFFKQDRSRFTDYLIDADNLPDADIIRGLDLVNNSKSKIDLGKWINPFESFLRLQVDDASIDDNHPGPRSQKIYADLIYEHITKEIYRA